VGLASLYSWFLYLFFFTILSTPGAARVAFVWINTIIRPHTRTRTLAGHECRMLRTTALDYTLSTFVYFRSGAVESSASGHRFLVPFSGDLRAPHLETPERALHFPCGDSPFTHAAPVGPPFCLIHDCLSSRLRCRLRPSHGHLLGFLWLWLVAGKGGNRGSETWIKSLAGPHLASSSTSFDHQYVYPGFCIP
jgi:hypothetical protein